MVTPFDADAYGRWIAAAPDGLEVARYNADGGFHHVAVLHAEQASQCALKALLRGVGTPARGHDLLGLAEACEREAGLVLPDALHAALADLAREYQSTRYPDALPGGTPRQHYGPEVADLALATAEETVTTVASRWEELAAEADDGSGEAGP